MNCCVLYFCHDHGYTANMTRWASVPAKRPNVRWAYIHISVDIISFVFIRFVSDVRVRLWLPLLAHFSCMYFFFSAVLLTAQSSLNSAAKLISLINVCREFNSDAVGWGTLLHAWRSQVQFLMRLLGFLIDLLLVTAPCPLGQLSL